MKVIKVDKSLFSNDLMGLKKFSKISYWYLLLDNKNKPIKEIGFNVNDEIIYKAPNKNDYGFFSDSSIYFESADDFESVEESFFNSLWNSN